MRIVLMEAARWFTGYTEPDQTLVWTGILIPKGTEVECGEPVEKIYDHRDQWAIPFWLEDGRGFMLWEEISFKLHL